MRIFLILTGVAAIFYVLIAIIAFLTTKKKTVQEKSLQLSDLPTVTVQIPTYNELAALNCVKRCLNFDYPIERLQIIIGDDSSDKKISKQIDLFALEYPDQVLVTRRGNNLGYKPGNLNHMLQYSTGEIIVIFDSDFLPKKEFMKEIVKPFILNPEIAAVQARWSIRNFEQSLSSLFGGTIAYYTHYVLLPFTQNIGGTCFLCGSAEAIRKSVLIEIGEWSEHALTEDIEYTLRLMINKKKILFLPHLKCEGEAPFILIDLCKQQMRWAYGNINALKKYFKSIFSRKRKKSISFRDRMSVLIFLISYCFSFFVFFSTIFGFLGIVTINFKGITLNWDFILSPSILNIVIISCLVVVWIILMILTKNTRSIFRVTLSMLTVGLVATYFIVSGIIKALFGKKMKWFMVKKKGNDTYQVAEKLSSTSTGS
ncbi:MAG: glycosyltransferase family 2 protein [Candidatus Lokiarchaeota archaeon]|nr:glycosyltransferase family 2 protein [Candidatus Lokiarchaeota archaeon]